MAFISGFGLVPVESGLTYRSMRPLVPYLVPLGSQGRLQPSCATVGTVDMDGAELLGERWRSMSRLTETIRHAYQSFADDPDSLWDRIDAQAVFHVAGRHPLSGVYAGTEEIRRYLTSVREATGGRGGYSVTSAFADETGELVMVEGTAFHGQGPFVRTVVHRLRLSDGKVVEFRDHPFDQEAEDRLWSARVPAQRDRSVDAVVSRGRAESARPRGRAPSE